MRSLRSNGKGACILPHGVLFRDNAEAEIRKNLIRKGYIKGIIGLPANLFYGTGIPACMESHFTAWRSATAAMLKALQPGFHPKALIAGLDESLLAHYAGKAQIQPMPSTCFRRESIGDI